jgi:uncharacterized protein (TIGR00288 family)
VSPWWLRPPGEESDESEVAPQQREDKDRSKSGGQDVPSIADLVGGRSGAPAESEPNAEGRTEPGVAPISVARERSAFFAPRRAPEESAQEQARAEAAEAAAYASDLAEARESTDSRDASEPSEAAEAADTADASDTSDTPENGEAAERPGRRRRRRGGRGRSRGGSAAAPASAGEADQRSGGAKEAPRDWEEDDDDDDDEDLARELLMSMPVAVSSQRQVQEEERKIALFCDLENVALGVRDSESKKFDINLVLERLVEKGKIIVKRAYADWERYSEFKIPFHEAAIELIDIPQRRYTGKNSADIKMVVDAMDLSYSKEHLDTFVLLSGDSDFSPLVSKLKENNKYVIGIGVKNSSSNLLIDNCDEFIFYEDVWRDQQKGPELTGLTKKKAEVFQMLTESILALQRENKDVLWGSMIKQTMKRKKPSFNEGYYGYSTFSELLQDAERNGLLKLRKDERSGSWVVMGFAKKR